MEPTARMTPEKGGGAGLFLRPKGPPQRNTMQSRRWSDEEGCPMAETLEKGLQRKDTPKKGARCPTKQPPPPAGRHLFPGIPYCGPLKAGSSLPKTTPLKPIYGKGHTAPPTSPGRPDGKGWTRAEIQKHAPTPNEPKGKEGVRLLRGTVADVMVRRHQRFLEGQVAKAASGDPKGADPSNSSNQEGPPTPHKQGKENEKTK